MDSKSIIKKVTVPIVLVAAGFGIWRFALFVQETEKSRLDRLSKQVNKPFYEKDSYNQLSQARRLLPALIDSNDNLQNTRRFLRNNQVLFEGRFKWFDSKGFSLNSSESSFVFYHPTVSLSKADRYLIKDAVHGDIKGIGLWFELDSLGEVIKERIVLDFQTDTLQKKTNFDIEKSYANLESIEMGEKWVEFEEEKKRVEEIEERRRQVAEHYKQKEENYRTGNYETIELKDRKRSRMKDVLPTYVFKSSHNDLEDEHDILQTSREVTYHTFNFEDRLIITEAQQSDGGWKTFRLPMKSSYKDGMTYVIEVNQDGYTEAWFSPTMNNLGYDFYNGQRLAFYGITRVE